MPEIISTKLFDHTDTNPGAPSKNSGPTWAKTLHDHLPAPGGGTIGEWPNERVRPYFARIGLDGAHTSGREVLCQKYGQLLRKVHDAAGEKAVVDWLKQYEDSGA